MADQQGAGAIPDINDPSYRGSRAEAMAAIMARRRETALADMAPEDAAALAAQPLPKGEPPLKTLDEHTEGGEDADADSTAADAERRRIEAEQHDTQAEQQEQQEQQSQLERQSAAEPRIIDDAELARYRVRTKVNGEERIVPLDELRATAQKTAAADQYLETAKQTLAEAKAARSQLDLQRGTTEPNATTSAPAPGDTSPEPDPIDVAIDSLFQGDEARAKEALRKLAAAPPAAPSADALARQVEQTMVIRSAIRQFAKDHKPLMADPVLRAKADEFVVAELRGRGLARLEDADPDEIPAILNTAGTRTKEHLARALGLDLTQANRTGNVAVNRRAEKARIDELPSTGTRAASTAPAPRSTSDVIEQMRQARMPQAVSRR